MENRAPCLVVKAKRTFRATEPSSVLMCCATLFQNMLSSARPLLLRPNCEDTSHRSLELVNSLGHELPKLNGLDLALRTFFGMKEGRPGLKRQFNGQWLLWWLWCCEREVLSGVACTNHWLTRHAICVPSNQSRVTSHRVREARRGVPFPQQQMFRETVTRWSFSQWDTVWFPSSSYTRNSFRPKKCQDSQARPCLQERALSRLPVLIGISSRTRERYLRNQPLAKPSYGPSIFGARIGKATCHRVNENLDRFDQQSPSHHNPKPHQLEDQNLEKFGAKLKVRAPCVDPLPARALDGGTKPL